MESTAVARRMHIALTVLYVAAVVALEVMVFLRAFHLSFLLLLNMGFTYAIMGALIGTFINSIEADGSFLLQPWTARTLLWICVVAIAAAFINVIRLVVLLSGSGTAIAATFWEQVSTAGGVDQAGLETLLRHHLHTDEWFVLLVVLIVVGLLVALHTAAIVYFARAAFPRLSLSFAAGPVLRPYNAAATMFDAMPSRDAATGFDFAVPMVAPSLPPAYSGAGTLQGPFKHGGPVVSSRTPSGHGRLPAPSLPPRRFNNGSSGQQRASQQQISIGGSWAGSRGATRQ